jgi:RNA polymerase sigma factor (sigma-70 family)
MSSKRDKKMQLMDGCLERLAAGDDTAWDELIDYAFDRLQGLCRTLVYKQLSEPDPRITPNVVLAEVHKRLVTAMKNPKVQPKNAEQFLGLAARNIRWQIGDMIRARPPLVDVQLIDTNPGARRYPDGRGLSAELEAYEAAVKEEEKWCILDKTLNTLSENEREIFDLCWTLDLSQSKVAELLSKTRNEVDSIWRKVKKKIGAALKDYAPNKL